jgi:5-methylthioadenosine/S-adenosylhomocysteine deaminase
MNLLRAAYVIADPSLLGASVIRDGAVVFENGQITEVGAWQDLQEKYAGLTPLGIPYESLVIPGLINAHHHGRGLSTTQVGMVDKPLELWLPSFILYPPLDPYLDALYTAARMLKSGVTTSLQSHSDAGPSEAYRYRAHRSLEAYQKAGVRIAFALGHYDQNFLTHTSEEKFFSTLPEALAKQARNYFDSETLYISTEDYFDSFRHLHQEFSNSKTRLLFSPCGFHWASPALQRRMAEAAQHYQTQVHLHALETPYQRAFAEKTFGKSTAAVLGENGLLGEHISLAHGIYVTPNDIRLIAETRTMIVTNPSSNLRLGSGVLPLDTLRENTISVALGMDSMSLFANDDMLGELALVQALHRRHEGKQLTPYQTLEMATVHGAKATGFKGVGKLLTGYQADIAVIDLGRFHLPYLAPEVEVVSMVLAQGKSSDIEAVWVAGEQLVAGGQLNAVSLSQLETKINNTLNALGSKNAGEKKAFLHQLETHLLKFYTDI